MVSHEQEKYGWEFIFLGANIDAVETAGRIGISEDRTANFHSDRRGTALNYEVLADAVCEMRSCAAPISADWKKRIDEDYKNRRKR